MEFRNGTRPSPIAGTWYTSDPVTLSGQIDAFLDNAKISDGEFSGHLVGIVSPHAGHRYSGRTAGYAYRLVQDQPRKMAVILSPFHQYNSGDFLTTFHTAYETPLGKVNIEVKCLLDLDEKLRQQGSSLSQVANDEEHALEIQLPFLQRAWKQEFILLPVMIRTHDKGQIHAFSNALYEVIKDEDFLLVASTDLSHFYPLDHAEVLDAEMLKRIKAFDPEAVLNAEAEGSASACGASSVAAMLWTARLAGGDSVHILNYSTSADSTGDLSSVVGYGAAAVTAPA